MEKDNLVAKSEDKSDLVGKTKTIYEASGSEIFWKNFLAGFGRGLGGVFVYLIFLVIIGIIFYTFVLPKLMPLVNTLMDVSKSLNSVSNVKQNSGNLIPVNFDIQKLLGQ